MTTFDWIVRKKIIAIARGLAPEYILSLANALYNGGIDIMEITFDQVYPEMWRNTAAAIQTVCMAGKMLVGAGTVMIPRQLNMALDAGAKYIVTPNTDPNLIHMAKTANLCVLPGAMTPTEIAAAYAAGADAVKVFPAGVLGAAYIKAVRAPLANIPLIAVGGITEKNAAEFLRAGCRGIGAGGNLVNKDWIYEEKWEKITQLAREYRDAVDG